MPGELRKMSSVRLGDTDIMVVGEQKAPDEDDDDGDGELTRASASLKPSPGKSLLRKLSSKGVGRDRAQSDATASSGSSMRGASFQMTTVDGRDEALEVGKPKARFGGGFLSGMKKAVGLGGGNEAGPYADKLKPASQSEMHGWLHKQGTKVTSWSHRYFVLQGPIFAYFEDEKAAMAADLSKCHGSGLVKSAERWPPQSSPPYSSAIPDVQILDTTRRRKWTTDSLARRALPRCSTRATHPLLPRAI